MRLLGKNKVRLLRLFYGHPEKDYYMQEIGRILGKKPGVFQRELNNLQKEGLLLSEYRANARFFRLNKNYSFYNEFRNIILKSAKAALALFLLSALLLPRGLGAQEDGTLSLKEVIVLSFQANKDIQIQEKGIDVANANILEATSRFMPKVDFNYSYTHNKRVIRPQNIFTGYNNDNKIGLSLYESIYNGGADLANYQQMQLNLKVASETLRAKKLDVEFEAKRLYYGLLYAYETRRIAQEELDQAQAHYDNVYDKLKHGTASRFDALQSKVQVSLIVPQVVQADNDIEYLKAELNKLFSRKVDTPIETSEKLDYAPREIDEAEFLKTAYLKKPELILKELGVDLSNWSIMMAKAGYRPNLSMSANYTQRSENTGNIFDGKHRNWDIGLSLKVPIFDGFSSKAKVDAAKAQYAQAVLSKENLSDQIAVDVRKGCLDSKAAEAVILSQKDNIVEAREALRISEVAYDCGVGINLNVLDAQVALAQVQKNLAGGIYDYLMAQAYLDRSMANSYIKEEDHGQTQTK